MIKAECHSDDRVGEVQFDATPWFAQADDGEILKLASCDWGGDYPSDNVAIFMADHAPKISALFTYLDARNKISACGFECHVDPDSAMEWISENRPHLREAILAEAIGLGAP